MPKPDRSNEPRIMTKDQIDALAEKIVNLVREECLRGQYCEGPGESLMLAAHRLLGWRGLRDLIR